MQTSNRHADLPTARTWQAQPNEELPLPTKSDWTMINPILTNLDAVGVAYELGTYVFVCGADLSAFWS